MRRQSVWMAVAAAGCALLVQAGETLPGGGYRETFEAEDARAAFKLPPHARWVQVEGRGYVLEVVNPQRPGRAPGTVAVTAPFDLRPYAGKRVIWQADIRQEDVSVPPDRWNGVKCMLSFETPATGKHWPQVACPTGSSDWSRRTGWFEVPEDIGDALLNIGLQDSTGTVWVDNLTLTLDPRQRIKHPPPMRDPPLVSAGHDGIDRLRGAMIRQTYDPEALKTLAAWNANLIRYQMTRNWDAVGDVNRDKADFMQWIDSSLATLDKILVDCEKLGILVCIDLHTPPGGRYEDRACACSRARVCRFFYRGMAAYRAALRRSSDGLGV